MHHALGTMIELLKEQVRKGRRAVVEHHPDALLWTDEGMSELLDIADTERRDRQYDCSVKRVYFNSVPVNLEVQKSIPDAQHVFEAHITNDMRPFQGNDHYEGYVVSGDPRVQGRPHRFREVRKEPQQLASKKVLTSNLR